MSPCSIDRRLRRCAHSGTQNFPAPWGVLVSLVDCFPPRGAYLRPWLTGPCASPRAGGTGARVQGRSRRPQTGPELCKASAGAAWGVAQRVRCTSGGRSASAACGVRGVRVPHSRPQSRQSDSSKRAKQTPRALCMMMMSSKKSHRNAYGNRMTWSVSSMLTVRQPLEFMKCRVHEVVRPFL